MKKNITIVSYATFPSNNPRSLRTHELAKQLASIGHNVKLYVLDGGYDYKEYSAETNIKVKSLGKPVFFNFNHHKGTHLSFFTKVIRKLIGKYFEFPSTELVFKTYKALQKEKKIDLLITIASPYTIHWGASLYRSLNHEKLSSTIWVADCGDPYMGNPFKKPTFYFKYIEKWFCKNTDYISVPLEDAKAAYYPEFKDKIRVIPQGFNFSDTEINSKYIENNIPTFIYAGMFYEGLRDPRPFLQYLSSLKIDFKFIVYTRPNSLLDDYIEKLGHKLEVYDYISRTELISKMSKADFLINLENPNKTQSPSKLIDYSLSHRPILNIDTNLILNEDVIDEFLHGNYKNQFIIRDMDRYDIKRVAEDFLKIVNN